MSDHSEERLKIAEVALDPRSGGSSQTFSYLADPDLEVGTAVLVPLGTRSLLGYVLEIKEMVPSELGFSPSLLKPVNAVIEGLSVPEPVMNLVRQVAEEYLCSVSSALAAAVPPGVRDYLVDAWELTDNTPVFALSAVQGEALNVLKEIGGVLVIKPGKAVSSGMLKALRALQAKGLVKHTRRVAEPLDRRRESGELRLTPNEELLERFLKKEGLRRPAQALAVLTLQHEVSGSLSSTEIRALTGVTDATVRALVTAGILERVDAALLGSGLAPEPNLSQRTAIDAVNRALLARRHEAFLLYGVTGSGKTEVYLRCIAEALRQGRQALFLVPEITLALQAIFRLRERFGKAVTILHSELPATERMQNWMRIRSGEASVVVGARSALFAPLVDVGLVVVDEEHETAYKQETTPKYHARAVAGWLAKLHQCPVLLGSATPSVESFAIAEATEEGIEPTGTQGLTMLTLPERAASAQLPEVQIVDLSAGYRAGRPAMLSSALQLAIEETLQAGRQTILFLNRRAYSPFLLCRECGFRLQCPDCSVTLAFHRRDSRCLCHQCGRSEQPPESCPRCGGHKLSPLGIGTEKVEEAVKTAFPTARVARLDRDVASKKGVAEEVLAGFRAGTLDILVGTQMVAKGLDFPNVTLVGVILADTALNFPDFRATERTFQLLTQVAGRAGRGEHAGRVLVQTFNPEHPAILNAASHDYLAMYKQAIQERRDARYPPVVRLVNVLTSGPNRAHVDRVASECASRLEGGPWTVLGPVSCFIERIQTRWRKHLLVKLPLDVRPSQLRAAIGDLQGEDVQIQIDVDPATML